MRIQNLIVAAAIAASGQAAGATFTTRQIAILGNTVVSAQAISDRGVIVGTYQPVLSPVVGFVLNGSSIYLLANSYPTAINRGGEVTGFGSHGGFLWKNGGFSNAVNFPVIASSNLVPNVLINDRGEIAYTTAVQTGAQVFAGPATRPRAQKGLSVDHAYVSSINNNGILAGFEQASVNGNPTPAFFIGSSGFYDVIPIEEPEVEGTPAIFVNDAGTAAFVENGSLVIYANGNTTTLPAPAPKAENVTITGFNNGGRMVGTYDDASQTPAVQSVFYYSGTTFFTFASFPVGNTIHVALNNHDAMVVSNSTNGLGAMGMPIASYLVTCSGKDC